VVHARSGPKPASPRRHARTRASTTTLLRGAMYPANATARVRRPGHVAPPRLDDSISSMVIA
jgi:hypothetical protein